MNVILEMDKERRAQNSGNSRKKTTEEGPEEGGMQTGVIEVGLGGKEVGQEERETGAGRGAGIAVRANSNGQAAAKLV